MRYRSIPENSVQFNEIKKYVTVSRTGHGTVIYRIVADRFTGDKAKILHTFGKDEGPSGKLNLPGLKAMQRTYYRNRYDSLYVDNAFRIRPYSLEPISGVWQEINMKNGELGFALDVNKTFKDKSNLLYTWMWSKTNMFSMNDKVEQYTSTEITSPINKLFYQVAFGRTVILKGCPVLVKIDLSGKATRIKRLLKNPMPDEDYGIMEITDDDLLCDYYSVKVDNPEPGAVYKIIWHIAKER